LKEHVFYWPGSKSIPLSVTVVMIGQFPGKPLINSTHTFHDRTTLSPNSRHPSNQNFSTSPFGGGGKICSRSPWYDQIRVSAESGNPLS